MNIDLNNKTDLELISLVKENGDSEAFVQICRRYEDIFYKVCHKYDSRMSAAGINCKDIYDEKDIIIFHCVKTFNPTKKAKLGTWIGNFARYLCLNSINSRKYLFPSCDEEVRKMIENSQSSTYIKNTESSLENRDYIYNLLDQIKDKRVADVIKLRYLSDKKVIWNDVATKMGISVQTCINLNLKGLKLLKKKIKSTNFSDTI